MSENIAQVQSNMSGWHTLVALVGAGSREDALDTCLLMACFNARLYERFRVVLDGEVIFETISPHKLLDKLRAKGHS